MNILTITLKLCDGIANVAGQRIYCPECGEGSLLTVRVSPDETDDAPTYVQCPWDHLWAEASLPRRLFAELLAAVAAEDPAAWAELNRVLAERGSFTAGPLAP
ncbi:hypothetical protein ACFV1N_05845 [Streptosporangium canum]|uniref:hypothetical protein n=1 Tax=Streptosporangium canum TaxID=324952 RepID=UPI00367534E4